ncbi:STAS domain-containing protein [Nonomuraea sp. NPDC047897]|uniref:STAS domain-containing protein n=1 Tax=Nonomuraea sp. NPDC047897 TaxID=3364346 RepID=UPI003715F8B8
MADPLTLTTTAFGPHAVGIGMHGDLDHATAAELLAAADAVLSTAAPDNPDAAVPGTAVRDNPDAAVPGTAVPDTLGSSVQDTRGLRELRLDCAGLGLCDSSGLAALLVIRRRASEAGVRLRLDHRGAALDRLLDLTGTLEHLTGEPAPPSGRGGEAEGARGG